MTLTKWFRAFVALGLIAPASAAAQAVAPSAPDQTLQLTLDEAVRRAVESNPELAVVKLGIEVEAARVGESRTAFTPLFSTTVGRSSVSTPPSTLLVGSRGVDTGDLFTSTGVAQRLP